MAKNSLKKIIKLPKRGRVTRWLCVSQSGPCILYRGTRANLDNVTRW